MTNSQRLAIVRACLTRWLDAPCQSHAEASPEAAQPPRDPTFAESILIRDGFYCGRRFDAGSHRAIWFLEEDELKIFTHAGQLAAVLAGDQITELAARASEPTAGDEAPTAGDEAPSADSADVLPLRAAVPQTEVSSRRAA